MNLKLELRSVRKLLFSLWGKYVVYGGKQGVSKESSGRICLQFLFYYTHSRNPGSDSFMPKLNFGLCGDCGASQ